MPKILKYNDVLMSLSTSLTISAFFYQIYLLLFFAFLSFFLFVMTEDLKSTQNNQLPFKGNEFIFLNITRINLLDLYCKEFMFLKDGIKIFRLIKYKGEFYEFFSESYKIDLTKYQNENFLLAYPGILYKKSN